MTALPYYSMAELVAMIDEPNRSICRRFLHENADLIAVAAGSSFNHQAWEGGWLDHTVETMNFAVLEVEQWKATGRLALLPPDERFDLSEALVVMFLHDLEKVFRWKVGEDDKLVRTPEGRIEVLPGLKTKAQRKAFVEAKIQEYGFKINDRMRNALLFVEGIPDELYTPHGRLMGPLASLAHVCDVKSARGHYDSPLATNDPWKGAKRSAG